MINEAIVGSEYVEQMQEEIKSLTASLNNLEDAVKTRKKARTHEEFEKDVTEAYNACTDMMNYLSEMVRCASNLGVIYGKFPVGTIHQIEQYKI
ncbi:hypothetical protein [uncultured Bacteroides sp.]|jgi:glutamine synthetase type III|uniref:hypothetical protein n=1 Tax=uncultured Bacteroides sp. TaxID=162156 RepID=UPI0020499514|nr:hypothetical protein [uncultured Bacteroides sp.]DAL45134.1 MAG TPA_asm: hypothetical protein [Caudoviricetes sp.]